MANCDLRGPLCWSRLARALSVADPAAWTGDIEGTFEVLAAHIKLFPEAAATMLYTAYSADLGGFRNTFPEECVFVVCFLPGRLKLAHFRNKSRACVTASVWGIVLQPPFSLTPLFHCRYVRWLQWACFMGVFRTHGSGNAEKRIWKYETYPQLADAMRLRGALMPWLYSLVRSPSIAPWDARFLLMCHASFTSVVQKCSHHPLPHNDSPTF